MTATAAPASPRNPRSSANREKVRRELNDIREAHDEGLLRPEDVVAFARNPKTELHKLFTWDDSEAAHQYRLEQARHIIRVVVRVLPNGPQVPTRVYVSLNAERVKPGGGYRTLVSVLSDEESRANLLAEALRDLEFFQRKYAILDELADVFAAMNAVRRRISKAQKKPRGRKRRKPNPPGGS